MFLMQYKYNNKGIITYYLVLNLFSRSEHVYYCLVIIHEKYNFIHYSNPIKTKQKFTKTAFDADRNDSMLLYYVAGFVYVHII